MAKKPASSTPSSRPSTNTPTRPANPPASTQPSSKPSSLPTKSTPASLPPQSSFIDIVQHIWSTYLNDTPARTLLLDVFMAFLVLVGALQFLYCCLAGNYPFNAFLSGFSAAVGQFVLTASLRMQTAERIPLTASLQAKKGTTRSVDTVTGEVVDGEDRRISSERAFADYVFGSLILHGFCVNFIN